MSYKQKAIEELEELAEGTRGVVGATIRLCIMILKEIPEEETSGGSHHRMFKENFPPSAPGATLTFEEDVWFPTSEPPKESGPVIVCGTIEGGRISYISNMNYSAKHNDFNCMDWYDSPSELEIRPSFWRPMPKRVEDLRIRVPKET